MTIQPYNPSRLFTLDGSVAHDALTQGEYEAFKAALPSWRDRLIAMVLRNTGLRINELLALEVRHCNLAGPGRISRRQAARELGIGYATLKRMLEITERP